MRNHKFPALLAGLLLGSGIAWSVHHLRSAPAPRSIPGNAEPRLGPSGSPLLAPRSLLLPTLLAGSEADAALETYLALPPLAKDASAAEIQERLGRLRTFLTILPDSHFERLLSALATRAGSGETRLRRIAFEIWSEHSAPDAARWALDREPDATLDAEERTRLVLLAALAWAHDDFGAAFAWTRGLGDGVLIAAVAPRLLGQLAATDPHEATRLAGDLGDPTSADAARLAVFNAWADLDPQAALQNLGPTITQNRDFTRAIDRALARWAARSPASALDWALAQPVPEDENPGRWIERMGRGMLADPAALPAFMDSLARRADVPRRDPMLGSFLRGWLRNDQAAALAWIDALPDVEQRSELLEGALRNTSSNSPELLLSLASRLPASAARDREILGLMSLWAIKHPEKATEWLARNDDPAFAVVARQVERQAIGTLAQNDPAAALARWQTITDDKERAITAAAIANRWSAHDPAAATRWIAAQLPPGAFATNPADITTHAILQSTSALDSAAALWARQDPLAFTAWIETLPAGPLRERLPKAFVPTARFDTRIDLPDPPPRAAYADQLARIADPSIREPALVSHLSNWLRVDRNSARAWLEANDTLSPEAAARLLTGSGSRL